MMFGGQLLKTFFFEIFERIFLFDQLSKFTSNCKKSSSDSDIRNIPYQKVQEM